MLYKATYKEWSQKRNFGLYRIKGSVTNLEELLQSGILTLQEASEVKEVLKELRRLRDFYRFGNRDSKMMYGKRF